jgi:hypothetical protein
LNKVDRLTSALMVMGGSSHCQHYISWRPDRPDALECHSLVPSLPDCDRLGQTDRCGHRRFVDWTLASAWPFRRDVGVAECSHLTVTLATTRMKWWRQSVSNVESFCFAAIVHGLHYRQIFGLYQLDHVGFLVIKIRRGSMGGREPAALRGLTQRTLERSPTTPEMPTVVTFSYLRRRLSAIGSRLNRSTFVFVDVLGSSLRQLTVVGTLITVSCVTKLIWPWLIVLFPLFLT